MRLNDEPNKKDQSPGMAGYSDLFFRYRPRLDMYDLVRVQLSWTVNERGESHFWKGWLVGVFYGADQSHQRGIPIDRHFVG